MPTRVSQESILAPLLFFSDVIVDNPAGRVTLFADDMSVLTSTDTQRGLISGAEECIDFARNYSGLNGLTLNHSKTELVLFAAHPMDHSVLVHCGEAIVAQAEHVKVLGMVI